MTDWLILMACQTNRGYFIPRGSYLHTLSNCFLKGCFCIQSNQIRIIFKQIYLTHRWTLNKYYHFSQSGVESKSKTKISPLDAV